MLFAYALLRLRRPRCQISDNAARRPKLQRGGPRRPPRPISRSL